MKHPRRVAREQRPQPLQRPQRPLLGRRLADAQHGADLAGRQLLQIPQHQHFSVRLRQRLQGRPHPVPLFVPPQPAAGAVAAVEEPVGQFLGRRVRQTPEPRLLPRHTATFGPHVAAVFVGDPVPGQLPQPGVERQRPLAGIAVQPAVGLGEDLLDHVGRVHAGGQPRVQAQGDHPPQPRPVPLQQRAAGAAVAGAGAPQQLLGVGRGVGHGKVP
jgi:hypothetical protein